MQVSHNIYVVLGKNLNEMYILGCLCSVIYTGYPYLLDVVRQKACIRVVTSVYI